jgi:hypothetical protein
VALLPQSHIYRAYNLALESNALLGGLRPDSLHRGTGDFFFSLESSPAEPVASRCDWTREWRREGELCAQLGRAASGEWAALFPGAALFLTSEDACRVQAYPLAEACAEVVAHFFLNQALPLALSLQPGALVLHAGAALVPDVGAVAFAGDTGAGKSTLSAAFGLAGRAILSDDGLLLKEHANGRLAAHPSFPSVRLCADMADALPSLGNVEETAAGPRRLKRRVALGSESGQLPFAEKSAPLAALCFLETEASEEITLKPVPPREAFMKVQERVFRLDERPEKLRAEFDLLGRFAESVPCFALRYPRDPALLPRVVDAIEKQAREARDG